MLLPKQISFQVRSDSLDLNMLTFYSDMESPKTLLKSVKICERTKSARRSYKKMFYKMMLTLSLITTQGSCEDMTKADSWEKVEGVKQRFECSGYESCKMAEMINVDMCSGANSCQEMEMDEASGDVACLGKYSCSAAYFHGNISGDVYCEGYQAVC